MELALTGQLPFILLAATILALPISFGLLRLYRHAVVRSMRSTGGSGGGETMKPGLAPEHLTGPRPPAGAVEALLRRGPWRAAIVYAIASGAAMGLLTAVAVILSPQLTIRQAVAFWIITNMPATIAVWIVLARPVRAVGPLVLTFMALAAVGANAAVALADADQRVLRLIVEVGMAIGLNAIGTFVGLLAVGAVVFGIAGWLALRWVGARYQKKRISDQSITLDAIWLFFGFTHAIGLAFEAPAWILTGPAAFLAFRLSARAGFAVTVPRAPSPGAGSRLLVLRVFVLGRQGERLFSRVTTHWRHAGSVQLIAGPDLAMTTVEPHEFLDFIHGRLARRFINGEAAFARRLAEMDLEPDRDGRYRINDFFCFDNAWQAVVTNLAQSSDAILVDLRGFSRQNAGVIFELNTLVDAVPLDRVVMATDDMTDAAFLNETIQKARSQMSAESPNRARAGASPSVVRLRDRQLRELPLLLTALARAAHA